MKLSRRQVLRSAGGLIVGLPALEALAPRAARGAPAPAPKRFIGLYHPNGVYTPQWFPTAGANEREFTMGAIHAPLAMWREHVLFTSGLDMSVALTGPGEQHQRGVGAFLTGAKLDTGTFVGNDGSTAGYAKGPSIDQTLVGLIGQGTRISSLQLGVHALLPNVAGVVSYVDANKPLLPQNDPKLTFRTLFMDSQTPATELDKLRARRKSVLDSVLNQASYLKKRVSTADQTRLDEHLSLIRDLENRVTAVPAGTCTQPADPGSIAYTTEAQIPVVAQLQIDLLMLAFRCDATRVATVMFSDAMNHVTMPHLNIKTDIHNLTHYADTDPQRAQVATRDGWQAGILAGILGQLAALTEADGTTALDGALAFWGSDVSRGNVHAHDDMPFVLAGHGAGFQMGRFVKWSSQYHNDLLVSILNGFGGSYSTYGDPNFCRGPLSKLT